MITNKKLFVDKTILIDATPPRVWEALTQQEKTDQWAAEFSSGGPRFHIEAEWMLGGPVLWKGDDGAVNVEGHVTALLPGKFLRFTVADTRDSKALATSPEDGITFQLNEEGPQTRLQVLHGDFSVVADGEKYCRMSAKIWDRVLPKIKQLAESPASKRPAPVI